jgi:hypothetical protein
VELARMNRKLYKYMILMVAGMILILNGLFSIGSGMAASRMMNDDQVIARAKALGYVSMKDAILGTVESGSGQAAPSTGN